MCGDRIGDPVQAMLVQIHSIFSTPSAYMSVVLIVFGDPQLHQPVLVGQWSSVYHSRRWNVSEHRATWRGVWLVRRISGIMNHKGRLPSGIYTPSSFAFKLFTKPKRVFLWFVCSSSMAISQIYSWKLWKAYSNVIILHILISCFCIKEFMVVIL